MTVTAKRVPIEPVPQKIAISIEITEDQARDLLSLCVKVGGDPKTTTRIVFDQLAASLYALDIKAGRTKLNWNQTSVYFTSEPGDGPKY
jgi:hypothetical protein